MPKPKNDKPAGDRRNVPLFITLPPEERARVVALAAKLGRPLSWTVRDALRLYLDALETDAAALARLKVDARAAGKTKQPKRGRPRGCGTRLPRVPADADPAALQAALDALGPQPTAADVEALLAELERNPPAAPKGKKG
jgi:predicted DNA-binding protein